MENNSIVNQNNNNIDIVTNNFRLSENQQTILFNIENMLAQRDIDKSKNHIFAKEHWLTEWQNTIRRFVGNEGLLFKKQLQR